ncbi:hypothetical protein [Actinotalea sp.]|uniref:hypothetical protein n=1 Tax=Actinotalea sp. TaxID=1872145 RepID=UPI0035617606
MAPLTVDPADRARVRSAQRAFRSLPKDLKNELRRAQRAQIGPIWTGEMTTSASRARRVEQQQAFRTGSRVKAGLPLRLVAGASNRTTTGGGVVSDLARPFEFGTHRRANFTRYARTSTLGKQHTVTRRAAAQLPTAKRSGWVVYPAVSKTIPRLIGVWVTGINKRIYDAMEGH